MIVKVYLIEFADIVVSLHEEIKACATKPVLPPNAWNVMYTKLSTNKYKD